MSRVLTSSARNEYSHATELSARSQTFAHHDAAYIGIRRTLRYSQSFSYYFEHHASTWCPRASRALRSVRASRGHTNHDLNYSYARCETQHSLIYTKPFEPKPPGHAPTTQPAPAVAPTDALAGSDVTSSPSSCSSFMISMPPSSLPSPYSCGYVGQLE